MSMQNAGSMNKAMIYFYATCKIAEMSRIKTLHDLKINGERKMGRSLGSIKNKTCHAKKGKTRRE